MGANEEYSVAVAGTEEEVFKVVISGVEEGSEKISFHYYLSIFGRQQRSDVNFFIVVPISNKKKKLQSLTQDWFQVA